MPDGGFFFDSIIRKEFFDEDNLDPEDNREEFQPTDECVFDSYRQRTEEHAGSPRYVLANLGGTGLGDIALVPAPRLRKPKGIRDLTELYVSTPIRQDNIYAIFDAQTQIARENLQKIFAVTGNTIDAMYICGTDFGTQNGPFIDPAVFRELYLPFYQRITRWIHANTG